jgi:3-hydroxyisobutyrate dehydrogenase
MWSLAVELTVLWDALKSGAGDTFVARHDVPSIFAGHYDPSFTLDLCCKDLGLIVALSQATQTQAPMTVQAKDRFEAARAAFGGDQAELLVCKLIEDASGVDLRVQGDWPKHWED